MNELLGKIEEMSTLFTFIYVCLLTLPSKAVGTDERSQFSTKLPIDGGRCIPLPTMGSSSM